MGVPFIQLAVPAIVAVLFSLAAVPTEGRQSQSLCYFM